MAFSARELLLIVVALLAEGVDRNSAYDDGYTAGRGRPPRGGRG